MSEPRIGRTTAALLIAIALAVATPGCKSGGGDAVEAEQAVRAYADALVPALDAQTLDPLRKVATPEEVDRVRLYVVKLTQQDKVRAEARLVSLEVEDVEVQGDSATLTANEQWTYIEKDVKSGEPVSRDDYDGEVVYTLVRDAQSGSWLVSDVESQMKR